ncbi:putative Formyl-coenzyme A transferase (Formyl-CoA transferase) [Bradyrhizobium sp. STM 3843]|uniref:CaiB/BaiF CoA transferase family protein n=1 Tax=Bradyrhizobium sp. STM 3843 TaxID=551947 RepID=UPI0002404368|nr:CoA transferase [Bradyrhizobium sp. STM 3843]CCE09793.1 putative Formyl-coenzyme A transferase (Formyl-CoA transferase) [Bradyrhizobium sp. STM 3843]
MTTTDRPPLPPPRPRKSGAPSPLHGLRVIDFSHFIAGPMCTLFLADMGADVIKIENAANGDDFRRFQPHLGGEGVPFLWVNRNKKGIALDLTNEAAQKIATELVASADILVENFSRGVMERFGLGYDAMQKLNPRLIYCSVSAYGRDGAMADRLGFDPVIQAETGFMSMNGFPDQPGVRTGPAIMDISTGMTATIAVLGALAARHSTGCGQRVETALFDTAALMLGFHAMNYLATGRNPTRAGNRSADSTPTGTFNTADGPLYITCANDRTFRRLVTDVLARPDLAEDPRFLSNRDRMAHRDQLTVIIEEILAGDSSERWVVKMQAAGVPAGVVRTIEGAFSSFEMAERALASSIPHPTAGEIPNIGSPLRFSETPVLDPVAAPTLGQHTTEVLERVLGYGPERIAELTAAGAFGSSG